MTNSKLKLISKIICCFLTTISLFFTSCETPQSSTSRKTMFKEIYVDQFKLVYLRSLLIKSYNNSNDIQNIIKLDKSGFTEPILTSDDYKLIDSLTMIDNTKLTTDSTNSIGTVAEGAEGKHILGYVVKKLESRWLDSLAKKRYKYAKVDEQFPE